MNISIRPEQPADIDEIYELNTLVFEQENEARLVDQVRQGSHFIPELSLAAYSDDKLIGYILFFRDHHHKWRLPLSKFGFNIDW